MFEYSADKYAKKYTSICLNVTEDCNLACRYCFVKQQPQYMSFETAKLAVDNLYNQCKEQQEKKQISEPIHKTITFFGGEPLLCFHSIIKPIVLYCEEQYDINEFSFSITTNGTLLTEEIADFFQKYKFSCQFSIDGGQDTQNYNRPCKNKQNSFDLIKENIPLFHKLMDKNNIIFRGTIYQDTVDQLFENYLFFKENNLYPITFWPEMKLSWSKEKVEILKQELKRIFLLRIFDFSNNHVPIPFEAIDKVYNDIIARDFFIKYPNLKNNNINFRIDNICGLGYRFLAIGPDGKTYGCQERVSYKFNENNIFEIGDNCSIDPKKQIILLEQVNKYLSNQPKFEIEPNDYCECTKENCFFFSSCQNKTNCISSGLDRNNMNYKIAIICLYQNELIKDAIVELEILSQINKINLLDQHLQSCSSVYQNIILNQKKSE